MLVGKGQFLDFQIVRCAQETVDIDAEGMCSQFGVESSAQAPESMGAVGFNRELCFELTGDGFDHLADRVIEAADVFGELFFLVFAPFGEQADAIVMPEVLSCRCADVGLVTDDDAVSVS